MIEEGPVHRAPQGIVLGIMIMTVFYLLAWMALRLVSPAPAYHCRVPARSAAIGMTAPIGCRPDMKPTGDCACRPL